jgi:hypothetical protein
MTTETSLGKHTLSLSADAGYIYYLWFIGYGL